MDKNPAVYLLSSGFNGTLYVGVTSNLLQRIAQHRAELLGGFTAKNRVKRLVWFEMGGDMEAAIRREKQIKNWRREWKIALIKSHNPTWRDLAEDLGFQPLIRFKMDPGLSPG
jgi:putative endonuclease